MKILLLGGTGVLSSDFTRKCLNENNEVWMLNRGRRISFIDKRAQLIIGDIRNETVEELRKKFRNVFFDVLIDFLSFTPEQLEKSLKVFNGLFNQYIFISSATVYIKTNEEIIKEDETAIGNKKWLYAYNKSLCEEVIIKKKINYTIIRPYVTYGESRIPFQLIPDGFNYTLLARIMNNKPVALLNNGEAICTLTNTVDFANILYKLLLNKKALGQAFHITSSSQLTWKDVYNIYCDILKREQKLISVSMEDIGRHMPEYYDILRGDKGTSWKFDNSKVISAVGGYEFQIDIRKGLEKSVRFFCSKQEMQGINYRWEGEMDRMICRVSNYKGMKPISSENTYNSRKLDYYVYGSPGANELYSLIWKLKHGR